MDKPGHVVKINTLSSNVLEVKAKSTTAATPDE